MLAVKTVTDMIYFCTHAISYQKSRSHNLIGKIQVGTADTKEAFLLLLQRVVSKENLMYAVAMKRGSFFSSDICHFTNVMD